jgi:excisionase family DNA binding protein
MSQETINQRIERLIEHFCHGNKSAFAKSVGITSQSLGEIVGGRQSAPSFAALQKIAVAYPSVSVHWLVMGDGGMLEMTDDGLAQELEEHADEIEAELAKQLKKGELSASIADSTASSLWQLKEAEEEARIELTQSLGSVLEVKRIRYKKEKAGDADLADVDKTMAQKAENLLMHEAKYVEAVRRRIRAERVLLGYNTNSLTAIYKLGDEPEKGSLYDGLLAKRLGISSKAAEELVKSGKIRATYIDGEGYRISEHSVRVFLGEFINPHI